MDAESLVSELIQAELTETPEYSHVDRRDNMLARQKSYVPLTPN